MRATNAKAIDLRAFGLRSIEHYSFPGSGPPVKPCFPVSDARRDPWRDRACKRLVEPRISRSPPSTVAAMQFRRVDALPPYAFAEIERLKLELRRTGEDVIDLGFGNPDIASPGIAVAKLTEAAAKPRNHRYSASRGIPKLREAICDLYARRFGVALDPEREALTTIGAKEGLAHLLWLLVEPGDAALVPA